MTEELDLRELDDECRERANALREPALKRLRHRLAEAEVWGVL